MALRWEQQRVGGIARSGHDSLDTCFFQLRILTLGQQPMVLVSHWLRCRSHGLFGDSTVVFFKTQGGPINFDPDLQWNPALFLC